MSQKIQLVSLTMPFGYVDRGGFKLWMQKRKGHGPLEGLWEFPGGKIEGQESPEGAAQREFFEEVGVFLKRPREFKITRQEVHGRSILFYVYISLFEHLPEDKGTWFSVDFDCGSGPYKGKIPRVNHELIDDLTKFLHKHRKTGRWNLLCQHFLS